MPNNDNHTNALPPFDLESEFGFLSHLFDLLLQENKNSEPRIYKRKSFKNKSTDKLKFTSLSLGKPFVKIFVNWIGIMTIIVLVYADDG